MMKRMVMLLVSMFAGVVFAAPHMAAADEFMPRKLEIEGIDYYYRFVPGEDDIPVTVTGSDAVVYFALFTMDKAADINDVQTNHLSWRTVNQVDTCVYVSPPHFLTEGEHVLEWDGHTNEGDLMRPGDYYYYLWGVSTEASQLVSQDITIPPGGGIIQTHDYAGEPLEQPVFYPSADVYATGEDSVTVTRSRWTIGADPLDAGAVEQTWYKGGPNWAERGPLALSPYAPDEFYTCGYDLESSDGAALGVVRRFCWVTGGEAEWDASWGDVGEVAFTALYPDNLLRDPGVVYIGQDELVAAASDFRNGGAFGTGLPVVDALEGYVVRTITSRPLWQPSPYKSESDVIVESINFREVHGQPSIIMGNHFDLLYIMLNLHDDDEEYLRYSTDLWVPETDGMKGIPAIGPVGFTLAPRMGDTHRTGLLAPDGTWMGFLPLAAEESPRSFAIPVDYDSTYDGLYFDAPPEGDGDTGLWYRGYDAFRGIVEINSDYIPLEIITPNGGEFIPGASTYTIRASHAKHPFENLYLKYSLNGGSTWTMTDSVQAGAEVAYDWYVPNVSSHECLIRIEWFEDVTIKPSRWIEYAQSDAPFTITRTVSIDEQPPLAFEVLPASPNPFNPSTAIEFILPEKSPVTVTIYNALGQRVALLQDGVLDAGCHRVAWNAADAGPGLYFYRVVTDAGSKTGKMMLVK